MPAATSESACLRRPARLPGGVAAGPPATWPGSAIDAARRARAAAGPGPGCPKPPRGPRPDCDSDSPRAAGDAVAHTHKGAAPAPAHLATRTDSEGKILMGVRVTGFRVTARPAIARGGPRGPRAAPGAGPGHPRPAHRRRATRGALCRHVALNQSSVAVELGKRASDGRAACAAVQRHGYVCGVGRFGSAIMTRRRSGALDGGPPQRPRGESRAEPSVADISNDILDSRAACGLAH